MVFHGNLKRNIPESRETLYSRQYANRSPHASHQNPDHALVPISINGATRVVMNGNSVWQRGVVTHHPERDSYQQCTTQPVNDPHKPCAFHIAVTSFNHFHSLPSFRFWLYLMSDTAPTSSLHPFEFLVAETEAGVVVTARRSPFLVVVRTLKVVQFEIRAAYLFHCFVLAAKIANSTKDLVLLQHL
jgi:hypothetical protein